MRLASSKVRAQNLTLAIKPLPAFLGVLVPLGVGDMLQEFIQIKVRPGPRAWPDSCLTTSRTWRMQRREAEGTPCRRAWRTSSSAAARASS